MTRAVILCGGSRGDTQPYVALGTGLAEAGLTVCLITDDEFESLVTSNGLEFYSSQQDSRGFMQQHMADIIGETNPLKAMIRMSRIRPLLKEAEEIVARIQWQACQGAELIIGHMLHTPYGLSIAEALSIPYVEVDVKPMIPTGEYPLTALPPIDLGSAINRFTHRSFESIMWHLQRGNLNRWRAVHLDLPPIALVGYYRRLQEAIGLRLCGVSQHIIPRPSDWPDYAHMTGYWTLTAVEDYAAPGGLVDFLDAGPPPLYVGFGSMPSMNPEHTADVILEALAITGQRGILYAGWGGLAVRDLPDSVIFVGSIPHEWLFPRMAAVVHHGGAGTTAAALRAGVPSIVVPSIGDQPFWGRRIRELGAGSKPIPRKKLTARALAHAIEDVLDNSTMRIRAHELGETLRAEDGVSGAAEIIQRHLNNR